MSAVWTAASRSSRLTRIIVATEDQRIVDACRTYGAESMLTSAEHLSGTDRAAEVVRRVGEPFDILINIQGDEPFVTPTSLDRLVAAFDGRPELQMATLAEPLDSADDLADPGVVKVVVAGDGRALYFSRAAIPYHRESGGRPKGEGLAGFLKHQGIYAYRIPTLAALTAMPPSPLELTESLEQLRALQAGIGIQVLASDFRSIAVDTPADLARAATRLNPRQEINR